MSPALSVCCQHSDPTKYAWYGRSHAVLSVTLRTSSGASGNAAAKKVAYPSITATSGAARELGGATDRPSTDVWTKHVLQLQVTGYDALC